MIRAPAIQTVRPIVAQKTVRFRGLPLVLTHGRGAAIVEWLGVLAFTAAMVALTLWVAANPSGVP